MSRGWVGIANGDMYERVMAAKQKLDHLAEVENERPGASILNEVAPMHNERKAANKNIKTRKAKSCGGLPKTSSGTGNDDARRR